MAIDFVTLLHWTTRAIEVFGILAIVVGIGGATVRYLRERATLSAAATRTGPTAPASATRSCSGLSCYSRPTSPIPLPSNPASGALPFWPGSSRSGPSSASRWKSSSTDAGRWKRTRRTGPIHEAAKAGRQPDRRMSCIRALSLYRHGRSDRHLRANGIPSADMTGRCDASGLTRRAVANVACRSHVRLPSPNRRTAHV